MLHPQLVAVMPIGPNCRSEFVADSLDSVRRFAPRQTRIVLVDDSGKGTGVALGPEFDAHVVVTEGLGLRGGLYLGLSKGFQKALESPFDVLLRLDTDALVAGPGFADAAHRYFLDNPSVGCLGSYRFAYDGGRRSNSWAARQLLYSVTLDVARRPRTSIETGRLLLAAKRNGYELGESVLGGICLYSWSAVKALADARLLGRAALARSRLQEDHIFGLLLAVVGYRLADFGTAADALPFGVKWLGLPASPAELLGKGKSLIHSTRSWGPLDEVQIRSEFAAARSALQAEVPGDSADSDVTEHPSGSGVVAAPD